MQTKVRGSIHAQFYQRRLHYRAWKLFLKNVPYNPVKCPWVSLLMFQTARFWKTFAEWLETAPTGQSSPGNCVAASLPPATWGAKTLQRTRAGGPKTWPVRLGGRQESHKHQHRNVLCWFCVIFFIINFKILSPKFLLLLVVVGGAGLLARIHPLFFVTCWLFLLLTSWVVFQLLRSDIKVSELE